MARLKANVKVRDRDMGWKGFKKRVASMKRSTVYVGVGDEATGLEYDADRTSGETMRVYQGGDVPLVMRALWNEFGTEQNPERSFLRSTVDENRWTYRFMLVKAALARIFSNRFKQYMKNIGERVRDDVRDKIDSHVPPPNADYTVKMKGFDHPLVETGEMRDAVGYRVEED
ncbi:MAG: hypothetical protein HOP09_14635 [Hyphomicrobium sp.]|nr:hypothetical protein [Hyphomicrobium sp.]